MIPFSLLSGLFTYPQVNTSFKLEFQETEFNKQLIKKCPILQSKTFRPSAWMPFALQHMLFAHLLDPRPRVKKQELEGRTVDEKNSFPHFFRREYMKIFKKGVVALDWVIEESSYNYDPENRKNAIVVILLPYTTTSKNRYIRYFAQKISDAGFSVVIYQNRGINGTPMNLPDLPENPTQEALEKTCGKLPKDFGEAMVQLRQNHPEKKIYAVGLSYGGNILCNNLGGFCRRGKCIFDGAAVLGAPLDMEGIHMNYVHNEKDIDKYLLAAYKKITIEPHKHEFETPLWKAYKIDYEESMNAKDTLEVDDVFTAKIFGYKDAIDFY